MRASLGDRLRYVFRHLPIADGELARPAAELVESESIGGGGKLGEAHAFLMTRSEVLTADDLRAVQVRFGAVPPGAEAEQAAGRVARDVASARDSGVRFTPTFFINGYRYDGPWDSSSFSDALLGSLGHRVRTAALSFASWAPSTGVLLLLASILAVVWRIRRSGGASMRFGTWHSGFRSAENRSGCRCCTGSTTGCGPCFLLRGGAGNPTRVHDRQPRELASGRNGGA